MSPQNSNDRCQGAEQWLRGASCHHTLVVVRFARKRLHRPETDPDLIVQRSLRPLRHPILIILIMGALAGALAGWGSAEAQDASAYDRAILGRGLDSVITYTNPDNTGTSPTGSFEPRPQPRELSRPAAGSEGSVGLLEIISFLILVVIGALIWKYGASIHLARRRTPDAGHRKSSSPAAPAVDTAGGSSETAKPAGGIEEIAGISDRNRALALLLNHVLEHTLAAHQTHFRRSQTVREALRTLPASSPVMGALQDITGYVERVRFGGHTVSEPVFQKFLESGRNLLRHTPRPEAKR
jgi:hypothetical protein